MLVNIHERMTLQNNLKKQLQNNHLESFQIIHKE